MGQYHDGFIRRYLETSKEHIINSTRLVFGQKANGFIFPLNIYVKVIPNLDEGVRFIAILNKLNHKNSFYNICNTLFTNKTIILIQCDNDGNVFSISQSALTLLGIPLNIVLGANNISSGETNILNIKTLFGISDIDWNINDGIKNKNGEVMNINTQFLKNNFEDFKESYKDFSNNYGEILEDLEMDKIFTKHKIVVFEQDLSFCDGAIKSKLFKLFIANQYNKNLNTFNDNKSNILH